jgi:hypothetical protein
MTGFVKGGLGLGKRIRLLLPNGQARNLFDLVETLSDARSNSLAFGKFGIRLTALALERGRNGNCGTAGGVRKGAFGGAV